MKHIATFTATCLCVALFSLSFTACDDDSGSNNTNECSAPEDCGTATGCRSYACDEGMCVTNDATAGTACTDDGGTVCDGQGSCVTHSCDTTEDCAEIADTWCDNGTCVPLKDPGAVCGAAEECASSFCADGYCCNTACDEGCDSCGLAGLEGTCSAVGQGEAGDPSCAPYVCDGASGA